MKQTHFELRAVILFLVVLLLVLGNYTRKKSDENSILRSSLEQEKQKNELQLDSLQELIHVQDRMQLQLKDSMAGLERRRVHINTKSNENKTAIIRINDIDSLRNAVARHYLQQ